MTQITSIAHLIEECTNVQKDGFIALNGGLRSSKAIEYFPDEKKFAILNYIDDSYQELTVKELHTESNIGPAIDKGAFYLL